MMITEEVREKIEATVKAAGEMILSAHLEKSDIHQKDGPANFVTASYSSGSRILW